MRGLNPRAQGFTRFFVEYTRLSGLVAYDVFGRRNPYFCMR